MKEWRNIEYKYFTNFPKRRWAMIFELVITASGIYLELIIT